MRKPPPPGMTSTPMVCLDSNLRVALVGISFLATMYHLTEAGGLHQLRRVVNNQWLTKISIYSLADLSYRMP